MEEERTIGKKDWPTQGHVPIHPDMLPFLWLPLSNLHIERRPE